MTVILGYARVSTKNQSTSLQRKTLKEAGCDEVFIDEAISGTKNRSAAGFTALMNRVRELRDGRGEVMVRVTKLDRFSRSLRELLEQIEDLDRLGASFETMDDSLPFATNTPQGRLMLTIIGAFGEFDRGLIKSRMDEGLKNAVEEGLVFGRKPSANAATVAAIREAYAKGGVTTYQLATTWGLSRSIVQRILNLSGTGKPYVTIEQWEAGRTKKAKR